MSVSDSFVSDDGYISDEELFAESNLAREPTLIERKYSGRFSQQTITTCSIVARNAVLSICLMASACIQDRLPPDILTGSFGQDIFSRALLCRSCQEYWAMVFFDNLVPDYGPQNLFPTDNPKWSKCISQHFFEVSGERVFLKHIKARNFALNKKKEILDRKPDNGLTNTDNALSKSFIYPKCQYGNGDCEEICIENTRFCYAHSIHPVQFGNIGSSSRKPV